MVVRRKPWFFCLSAFVVEQPLNRWGQDRQNFVSVFHDRAGLISGGGNTKMQPLWSNFTVGDTSLLKHTPGDADPDFRPKGDLLHVPDEAALGGDENEPELELRYGEETCSVALKPQGDTEVRVIYQATAKSGMPIEGHLTLLPHLGEPVRLSSGNEMKLGEAALSWTFPEGGGWVAHGNWRLSLPAGARIVWPALPHNPYRKGGEATMEEGRLVAVLPFSSTVLQYEMVLGVVS